MLKTARRSKIRIGPQDHLSDAAKNRLRGLAREPFLCFGILLHMRKPAGECPPA